MKPPEPLLLAIESSCDDTSVAVLRGSVPISNIISSQLVHNQFGGVVPEMASREHMRNIRAVAEQAILQAEISVSQLDAIAYTKGPGLPGSLMVGSSFAKGLALSLGKPLISVNHMEAHVLSLLIGENSPTFPFICLVVSGGHTLLVMVEEWNKMQILGTSTDDAVGEAFDKCAKLLGLGYPGGKLIDDQAKKGNPKAFPFPVAKTAPFCFSYSGVKTSFLYFLREKEPIWIEENLPDICASIQFALLKPLVDASKKALQEFGIGQLGIAGGVAANSSLRSQLTSLCEKMGANFYFPAFEYCTDNAAMIGRAAYFKYQQAMFAELSEGTESRLAIGQS